LRKEEGREQGKGCEICNSDSSHRNHGSGKLEAAKEDSANGKADVRLTHFAKFTSAVKDATLAAFRRHLLCKGGGIARQASW
jgi:hypothetical protein